MHFRDQISLVVIDVRAISTRLRLIHVVADLRLHLSTCPGRGLSHCWFVQRLRQPQLYPNRPMPRNGLQTCFLGCRQVFGAQVISSNMNTMNRCVDGGRSGASPGDAAFVPAADLLSAVFSGARLLCIEVGNNLGLVVVKNLKVFFFRSLLSVLDDRARQRRQKRDSTLSVWLALYFEGLSSAERRVTGEGRNPGEQISCATEAARRNHLWFFPS